MMPLDFERLSFRDQVLLFRLNFGCVAVLSPVVLLITLSASWETGVLAVALSAAFSLLAYFAEPILRWLDSVTGGDGSGDRADTRQSASARYGDFAGIDPPAIYRIGRRAGK